MDPEQELETSISSTTSYLLDGKAKHSGAVSVSRLLLASRNRRCAELEVRAAV